jgi:hypothetical protein
MPSFTKASNFSATSKHGRPLWRFSPPTDHGEIIRSPFRGFPWLHPAWMGRIAWFRRWRYDESTRLAEDQELLLRSYPERVGYSADNSTWYLKLSRTDPANRGLCSSLLMPAMVVLKGALGCLLFFLILLY